MLVKHWQTPSVVFQPQVYLGMQRGINRLANAIRPTLGPLPRLVMAESTLCRNNRPEMLDSGGLIARRITQLADRDEDVGAMLLRHMLWELHSRVGDGTATAAVIFQSVYNQGVRFIAAGGDANQLRFYLEKGSQLIMEQLEGMKIFIRGREQLTRLAETLCYDPDLAKWLGEIFDTIGLHGYLDIRTGNHRESKWEYFKGTYWEGGLASRLMSENSQRGSSRLKNAAILLSDLEIDEPKGLAPLLEVAARHRLGRMLVVAKSISERALSLLLSPPIREKLQILVVKTPGLTIDEQWAALQDLSILTGGRRPLLQAAGDSLGSVKVEFLGQAPHVYADLDQFGIIGTSCNPDLLEQHIDHLKDKYISTEDVHTRRKLLERIGKLQGGSAVLWVGASTPIDLETRKALAEKTSEAIRWAMLKGIVPGGGAAFLDCCPAVTASLRQAKSFEESTAYRILIQALHEPMSALLSNAGISAAEVIGQVEQTGPGLGFDLIQGQVVDMIGEGIYDSAAVAKAIVCCAVRGAAQALTTQVVVHRRNPPDASITT